jgi:predicted membrane protein
MVYGLGLRVKIWGVGVGCRVYGLGFRIEGVWFRV